MMASSTGATLSIMTQTNSNKYQVIQNERADFKNFFSDKLYKAETHSTHRWIEESSKFKSPPKGTSECH
jgi:hypothetical protein